MRHGDLVRPGVFYCALCDLDEPARSECFQGPRAIEQYRRGVRRRRHAPEVENVVRPLAELPREELELLCLRWVLQHWQIEPSPWLCRMLRPELDETWRFFALAGLEGLYRASHIKSPGPIRLRALLPAVGAVPLLAARGRTPGAKWWALPSEESRNGSGRRRLGSAAVLQDLARELGGPSDPDQIFWWCRGHPQEAMIRQLLRESCNPRQRFEDALVAIHARGERLTVRAIREQLGQVGPPSLSREEAAWRDQFRHELFMRELGFDASS